MRPYRENESRITPENNHQILTVFFIVASLLGVFFTLGYIVGRNSPFLLGPAIASAHEPELVSQPRPAHLASLESQPVASITPPAPVAVPKPVVAPPPVPKPVQAKVISPPPPVAEPALRGDHPAGTYLQLVATNKEGVDVVVDALRDKGFKAVATEIPEKRGWFRALVGPLSESTISSTRAELKTAGFAGDNAIKRSF